MNISLISACSVPEAVGLRFISSLMKSKGHKVQVILLTQKSKGHSVKGYSPEIIEQLLGMVKDSDLIGFSLMTNTYFQTRDLTRKIKEAGIKAPVVWGGVQPTVNPESCIDYADMVCVGEGEGPMTDLTEAIENGRDYSTIPNLWVKQNGNVIKNEVRPLFENLDELPPPDYDIEDNHYVIHRGKIVPATAKNMRGTLVRYRLVSTRGCPYNCAFCCNSSWLNVYHGKGKWVRKRSVKNIIAELEYIKKKHPSVNSLSIADDTFFVRDENEFKEFAELYRVKIGWPFEINTHPATITHEKVNILAKCGCGMIKMGIQSGCEDTNFNIFKRRVPNEKTIKAIEVLDQFPKIRKEYHFITSNPFEPDENLRDTLHFAAQNSRGNCRILVFPLALFPGSELHKRAKAEGLLKDEQLEIYEKMYTGKAKRRFDRLGYHTMLMYVVVRLRQWGVPANMIHKFIDGMLSKSTRYCLDRQWFKLLMVGFYMAGRSIRGTLHQIFVRPFRKHRRRYDIDLNCALESQG